MISCCYHVCEYFGGQTSLFKCWFRVCTSLGWLRCDPLGHYRFWVVFRTFGHFQAKHQFTRTGTTDMPAHLHTSTHLYTHPRATFMRVCEFLWCFLAIFESTFDSFLAGFRFHLKCHNRHIDFSRKVAYTVPTPELCRRDLCKAFEPLWSAVAHLHGPHDL